jgi:CBS domain-containing protein
MPIQSRVWDFMVPVKDYATVSEDQPLSEAVLTLRRVYCQVEDGTCTEAGHRTALVLDAKGTLVGILDFKSILAVLVPEIAGGVSARLESLGVTVTFAEADVLDIDETRAAFRARVLRNAQTRVKDVMLKLRGTIAADSDLMDALKLMYKNRIVVLPVFRDSELVGVLRDSDLFLAVASVFSE